MPEEPKKSRIRTIYDKLTDPSFGFAEKYDIGTFEEFQTNMRLPEKRTKLYNWVQPFFDPGDYQTFELDVLGYTDFTEKLPLVAKQMVNKGLKYHQAGEPELGNRYTELGLDYYISTFPEEVQKEFRFKEIAKLRSEKDTPELKTEFEELESYFKTKVSESLPEQMQNDWNEFQKMIPVVRQIKEVTGGFLQTTGGLVEGINMAETILNPVYGIPGIDKSSDNILRQISTQLKDLAEYELPKDRNFFDEVFIGLGSQSAFVMTAALGAGPAAIILESLTEAGSLKQQLINDGLSEEEADIKAWLTFGANVPLIAVTNKLGLLNDAIKGRVWKAGLSGFMEGIQEMGQEDIQSLTGYGEFAKWNERLTAGGVGFILGSGGSVLRAASLRGADRMINQMEKEKLITPEQAAEYRKNLEKIPPGYVENYTADIFEKAKLLSDIDTEATKLAEQIAKMNPDLYSGEVFTNLVSGSNVVEGYSVWHKFTSNPDFQKLQGEVAEKFNIEDPVMALEATFNVLRGTQVSEGLNPELLSKAQKIYRNTLENLAYWKLNDKQMAEVTEDVSEVTQPGEEFYFEASVGKEGTIYKSAESGEFVKGREYADVSFSDMPLEAEERVRAVIPQDKLAEYTNPDGLLNPQKILNSQDKELWEAKKIMQDYTTLDLLGPSALFERYVPSGKPNILFPKEIWIDKNTPIQTNELLKFRDEYAEVNKKFKETEEVYKEYEDSKEGIAVIKKYANIFDKIYSPAFLEKQGVPNDLLVHELIDRLLEKEQIRIDPNQLNLFKSTTAQNKALQGTISQKPIQSTSPIDKVSPAVSKEEPGGIRKYTPAQFNEILQKAGMVDESISEFGEWVFKQLHPDVEVWGVNADFIVPGNQFEKSQQLGQNRAAFLPASISPTKKPLIVINRQATNPKFYNSFVHEALHPFLLDKLKTNREFKEEMNAIYNEVKFRFSTDHSDYYNANKADLDRALENLDEFVAHGMSGTSVIHQWMKDTPLSNNANQSILQKFLDTIKALLSRLFANPSPTFHQAMELSFNKHFDAPSQFNYKDLLSETVQEIRQTEEIESFDRLFELEDGFDNPRFIRAVGELIAKSQNRTETDYIRYVKGLTQEQFRNSLYGNPEWMKAAKLSYSRQNTDLTEGEYLEKIITQLYNHAYNLEKHKTIRLVLNVTRDTEGNEYTTPTLQELGTTYRTKDNTFKSSWRNKTNLASRIPELNEIFGTEFEMVYLDDVKIDEGGNQIAPPQWKSIPETDFNLKNRNATYAQHLAKLGYIFPGTWSDKKTVVAFRPAQKIGTILQAYREIYTSQMNQAVFNELQKGEQSTITPEEAQVYTDYTPTDGEIFRLVIEDLKLGATVEDGRLNSVLFSKGIEDAVRIFKRATEVAQLSKPYQSQFTTQKILKKLGQWDHGIEVLDNGKLGVNTVIINGVPEKGQWVQTINYKGRELTIDFHDVLINELGTETTDGIELYLEDGYGKAYTELYGTTKKGAIKSFVLNDKNQSPLYVKGSQQLVKRDGTLGSWMESNNIGLIIFSSAAKITSESYPVLNVTSLDNPIKKGEYFTLPFDMINRDKEKGGVDLGAKGLTQSLTANLMAENNPYYADKGMEKVIKDMTDALIANFRKSMTLLDGGNILERLKQKALTSDDVYEKSLSQLILDYSYTVSDKKLASAQNLPFASEGILRGYRLNQRLSNEQIASEIEGLMHEPFFAEAVRGIVRSELQNVIHFKAPGSWMVLRPDLGWLAQENIDAVWDYLSEQYKSKVDEEINVLRDELDTTMGILKAEKNEKIQKDLEKNIAKIKEEIQQKETDRHGNSKTAQEAIWKELEKIVDPKSGRLKRGYGYISKDAEKEFNLGFLKPSISTVVPSDGITAQIPFKVIVLPEGHMNSASMVLNSEDVQTIAGKDFDIDTGHLLKDDKQYFPGDNYQTYYNTIEESHRLHREKIINAYSKVLRREITEAELYDEEIQKEFMQKLTRDSSDGQSIFNPLNAFSLLDKFAKEIGPVVNDRKSFTIKSQIGFSTKVFINSKAYDVIPASDGKYYLAAIRMTHDRVDMPTNTNGLFYEVDDEKLFDLMYNQSLVEDTDEFAGEPNANYAVSNALRAFKAADTFLFGRAVRLATPWNFEDRQADRHLPEDVQYIKEQKIINQLLKEGKNEELYNLFETWYRNRFSGTRKVLNARLAFAKDYILNLKTKDLSKSPVLYSVENIPLDVLPNIDISKELYKVWQREIAKEIIAEKYTSELEKVNKKRENEINAFKSPISKSLLRAFALTEVINPQLHLLKAKAISLILPVDQRLFSVKRAEKLQFTNNIYDIANQYSYPKLFELLLQERFLIFNPAQRGQPITLTHKGKEIILSQGQYNNLNIKIGNVTITGNDLYNSNTQWAQNVRAEFFSEEGIFKDSKNRFEFTKLLSFGRNIGLQGRIDAAVELIDNELGTYTQNEKEAFWDSLLGYPDVEVDGFPKAPLNFVAGIEGFSDQKTLLIIASRVKDKSGKDFLKRYTAAATKTYPGLRFSQVMEIKSAIQSGAIQEEQRVWYDKGYENEVKDNRIGFFENFLSIYSNIFDAPMDITSEEQMVEHTMLDLFTGRIVHPTRLGVTKYISRYATRQAADVNIEAIALTKYANYLRGILPYNEIYDRVNNKINEYTKKLNTNQKKLFYTRVNTILEQNPFGILVKRAKGTSVYYELPDGQKYIEDLDSIPSNLNRAEFSNKIDEMFTRLGIVDKDEIAANRAALLYRSIYDIWNIRYTANIANYLRHIRNNLPEGFQNLDLIEAELRKWETLTDRMAAMTGHYFPHVWEEGAYEENLLRQLEEEVRQQNPEVSGEELQRLVTEKRDRIYIQKYGTYVHGFQMRREGAVEGYIMDSSVPHDNHFEAFRNAVMTTLTRVEWLRYEHKAAQLGRTQKQRNRMFKWYALQSADRYLHLRNVPVDQVKPEDRIEFWHNGRHIKGQVRKIENGYVYLKLNTADLIRSRQEHLDKYRRVADSIAQNTNISNETPASPDQLKVLRNLRAENWVANVPQTMVAASQEIIRGLENMLRNSDNWARYRINDMMIRQFDSSGQPQLVNGVSRLIVPDLLDRAISYLDIGLVSSFLGNPAAMVRNWMEAHYRNAQEVGWVNWSFNGYYSLLDLVEKEFPDFARKIPGYSKLSSERQKGLKGIFIEGLKFAHQRVYAVDPSVYHNIFEKIVANREDINELLDDDKLKAVDAFAYKYIIEHGLLEKSQTKIALSEEELDKKVKRILAKPTQFFFGRSEGAVRRASAFMFAYKAIIVDKLTDPAEIQDVIDKGIEMTQSLYDAGYRRLGETTLKGKFGFRFTQYPAYQWEVYKLGIKQAKRLGQLKDIKSLSDLGFNVKSFFTRKLTVEDENGTLRTYNSGDSVDPQIPYLMMKQMWQDSIALMFMQGFPGFRAGNPISIAAMTSANIIAQWIANGEPPDEWDLKQWLFAVLSFRLGLGLSIPIDLVWQASSGNWEFTHFIPRLGNLGWKFLWNVLSPGTQYDLSDPKERKRAMGEELYDLEQLSKLLTGMNLVPHTRQYYPYELNRVTSKGPIKRIPEIILPEGFSLPSVQSLVPVWNRTRFNR